MFKNKRTILSSIFSILISSAGIVSIHKAFAQGAEVDRRLENYISTPNTAEKFPFVTILVPARNEAQNIQQCLISILNQDYPEFEIVAIDDASSDNTPQILQELALTYPDRLKLVKANPPVDGWLGKPNALWQGYQVVRSEAEWVLFIDADVKLLPGILRGAVAYARENKTDLLSITAGLEKEGVSFWHKMLIGEISKFYTLAYLNPLKPPKKGSVEEASAIGIFILAKKYAYDIVGGHGTVKNSIIEDIMLARSFRAKGFTTEQVLGLNYLKTEGYKTLADIWEGVTKNLFTVAHKNWLLVAFIIGGEFIYGIFPFINFFTTLINKSKNWQDKKIAIVLNIISIIFLFGSTNQLNRQFKIPWIYALAYPISAFITSIMLVSSGFKTQLMKKVVWKGRGIEL